MLVLCDFFSCRLPPPPGKSKFPTFSLRPNPKLQITPPPQKENCQKSWHFDFSVAEYPPPPPERQIVRNLGTLTFQLQNTPPLLWKIQISNFFPKSKSEVADYPPPQFKFRHFLVLCDFSVAEYPHPPHQKIVRNLGTLTFQLQKDLGTL